MPTTIRPESRQECPASALHVLGSAPLFALPWVAASALGCASETSTKDAICSQAAPALETCPGDAVVRGIDVSTYQETVDWSRVKAAGIAFAFARISDGTTAPDSHFGDNWTAMKEAGVLRGSYQYFRASEDAMAQASLVAWGLNDAGGLLPGDLPVVMDMETADGQSSSTVREAMTTWLAAVAGATGRPPIIYTNAAMSSVIGTGFADHALWVANWGQSCPTMPSGWSTWRFWQYSDTGSVSGVAGTVDLDEFDGALGDLMAFAGDDRSDADGTRGMDAGVNGLEEAGERMSAGDPDAARPVEPCPP